MDLSRRLVHDGYLERASNGEPSWPWSLASGVSGWRSTRHSGVAIVTYHYRPKITPAKLRPLKGPVIRLGEQGREAQPKRSAIVEPKRKRPSIFGTAPDVTEEELQAQSEAADVLWRELVRRAAGGA